MKVYLSSTFQDLRYHRAAVERTLRKMGHDVIGMEQYAAEGSRPVERCKRDVELADACVLILGWHYGYTPLTLDNPDGWSITEIEYRHAVSRHKTVLAFLLDPETPWPPSLMDAASANAEAAERISPLWSEAASEYLVGMFSSPDDLASQVGAAVASFGLTKPLSELVLNRTAVTAEEMGRFGTGDSFSITSLEAVRNMISRTGKDRALVVELGDGDVWWSTRLFLLASLLRSLTLVRQVAFTGRGGRFAGMASPGCPVRGAQHPLPGARRVRPAAARHRRDRGPSAGDRAPDRPMDRGVRSLADAAGQAPGFGRRRDPQATAEGTHVREPGAGRRARGAPPGVARRTTDHALHRRPRRAHHVAGAADRRLPGAGCAGAGVPRPGKGDGGSDFAEGQPPEPQEDVKIKVIDRDAFALELAREWVRAGFHATRPRSPIE